MPTAPDRRAVAVALLVPLVAILALWAFAWPAARIAPRDLPVGVAGAAPAAERMEQRFEEREGAFEVHRFADEAAAAPPSRTGPYTEPSSSARGAAPAHGLGREPGRLPAAARGRDGVRSRGRPGPRHRCGGHALRRPRGSVLGASMLPLALAGMAAGAVVTLVGLRGARAAATLVATAALAGIAVTAVAHSWLGALAGDWWTEAGALALTVLAIGSAVAGLAALLGPRGIGLGALLMVLLGNSFSGVTSAPELLPEPVGAIGQWLPPGAGGSLLRSVGFFDGGAAGGAVLTLSLWSALGLAAVLLARRKPAGTGPVEPRPDDPAREPALAG